MRVALCGSRRRRPRARLRGKALLDEPVNECEQRCEMVARWTDAVGAHQRRIQARDVSLHDAPRNAGREQMQRRAAVRRPIALLVCGERHAAAQIRAHQ